MRRSDFLKWSALAGGSALSGLSSKLSMDSQPRGTNPERERLFEAMDRPVLRQELLPDPVILDKIELRRNGGVYFARVVSREGVVGTATGKGKLLELLVPLFRKRIKPIFLGQDVRYFEDLYIQLLRSNSNYKWQSVPFGIATAILEFAILDCLGKSVGQSVGTLLGERLREEIPIYCASGNRDNLAPDELEYVQSLIDATGCDAVKIRLGARMHYTEQSTRRDKALIPYLRKHLGPAIKLYSDANGSYDVPMALEIGQYLEEHQFSSFEEPVPFDYYEETKTIADELSIPVVAGEQERSLRQFLWMIEHRGVDWLNPDPLLFGGLIRTVKVARMGAEVGMPCFSHMSGYGMGFLYVLHFAAVTPNAGREIEYKGEKDKIDFICDSSTLKPINGRIKVPTGTRLWSGIDLCLPKEF